MVVVEDAAFMETKGAAVVMEAMRAAIYVWTKAPAVVVVISVATGDVAIPGTAE